MTSLESHPLKFPFLSRPKQFELNFAYRRRSAISEPFPTRKIAREHAVKNNKLAFIVYVLQMKHVEQRPNVVTYLAMNSRLFF